MAYLFFLNINYWLSKELLKMTALQTGHLVRNLMNTFYSSRCHSQTRLNIKQTLPGKYPMNRVCVVSWGRGQYLWLEISTFKVRIIYLNSQGYLP